MDAPYSSDEAASQRRDDRQAKLRRDAEKRGYTRQEQRRRYLLSQQAARRYMQIAAANGAKTFPGQIYQKASAVTPATAGIIKTQGDDQMNNNPQQIDRIKLSETQEGKPIVELYSEPLKYAALTLFESQFGMLFDVGIDPNALVKGEARYTNFKAYWKELDKLNAKGNPYKDITHLEAINQDTDLFASILLELQAIKAILLAQADVETAVTPSNSDSTPTKSTRPSPPPVTTATPNSDSNPSAGANGRHDAPPPAPAKATITSGPPGYPGNGSAAPAPAEGDEMFEYVYSNGDEVEPRHHNLFNEYRRAHQERSPQDFRAAMLWFNNRSKGGGPQEAEETEDEPIPF